MEFTHFTKIKVDHRSRKAMTDFLSNHRTHADRFTLTPANCIKLNRLPIPIRLSDSAYDFISQEFNDFDFDLHMSLTAFDLDHVPYYISRGGRSGGWLELNCQSNQFGHEINTTEEALSELTISELRKLCITVQDFDRFCDDMLEMFVDYVEEFEQIKIEEAKEAKAEEAARMEPSFPL